MLNEQTSKKETTDESPSDVSNQLSGLKTPALPLPNSQKSVLSEEVKRELAQCISPLGPIKQDVRTFNLSDPVSPQMECFVDKLVPDSLLKKARKENSIIVIGLGEASHGVGESSLIKMELIQSMIKKGIPLRMVGFEIPYAEGEAVNKWLTGKSTEAVYPSIDVHKTKEIKDGLDWLHEYNEKLKDIKNSKETNPPGKPIEFFGFDPKPSTEQNRWQLLDDLYNSLELEVKQSVKEDYQLLTATRDARRPSDRLPKGELQGRLDALVHIENQLQEPEDKFRLDIVKKYVEMIHQDGQNPNMKRDLFMAEVTRQRVRELEPGDVVVVWAHDAHIGKLFNHQEGLNWGEERPAHMMGYHLDTYAADENGTRILYRAVGFETPRPDSRYRTWIEERVKNGELVSPELNEDGTQRLDGHGKPLFKSVKWSEGLIQQSRLSEIIGITLEARKNDEGFNGAPGCILHLTEVKKRSNLEAALTDITKTFEPWGGAGDLQAYQPLMVKGFIGKAYDFTVYTKASSQSQSQSQSQNLVDKNKTVEP